MWGKLTERNDRTRTKMISDPQELYRLLATPCIEVATVMFASDDIVWASWRYIAEEKGPNIRHFNEVIGAYVTAGARIELYGYLNRLQKRALYCDTDLVIYIQLTAEPPMGKPGQCLGAMTSELKPPFHIEKFVSGGPTNYAYTIVDPVTGNCETVYEITLNYSACRTVNFNVIKALVLRGDDTENVTLHTKRKNKRKRAAVGYI